MSLFSFRKLFVTCVRMYLYILNSYMHLLTRLKLYAHSMVFVFIVSNTQPGHTCTWRLAPLGCFSGRCHGCSTCGVVHCLHHTVVHWCYWTTIQDCQWNPCMMVILVQHVRVQYCSYNEHSAHHYWCCTVNLLN